jgi:cobalt/nickel transport system permease protein
LTVFGTALTPNGQWWTWAVYGGWIALSVLLSRVSVGVLLKRVVVEFLFIGVVLLGTLFRPGGQTLFQWGWIHVGTDGLRILASVSLKAALSLLILNVLILTTPIPILLHALVELRVPPLLVAIFASMHRYVQVLQDEFQSMQRAARSRNLMSNPKRQRLVIGNMMGSLFIRTYDRGERIHQAMLARGYEGLPRVAAQSQSAKVDIAAVALTTLILLLGQAVHWVVHAP